MASSINVAITVDNKQYIANIKAADSATKKFATDTETNLNKVNKSFDTFTRRVGGLKTALAGLAFGAVGRGALGLADNLQDLSNSSGIAVGRLLEFQNALATSGGQADQLPQAINTLLRSIDEAAGGSIKAQNSFMRLGVSLQDLGTLSEEDLLKETLKGIAAIENPSRRAAEMMDKFGKSFKTVDPQELLDKLNASAGSADRYAESIKRAAELNDKFVEVTNNLKLAFLEAFSGPIGKLLEFNTKTAEGATKIENLVTIVKALAIALAAAFAISGITALVAVIGQIGRAITVVTGLSAGLAGVFAAGGSLMVAIRGIAVAFTAFVVIVEGAQALFEPFSDRSVVAIMKIVEALGMLAAAMAGGAFGAAAGTAIGGPLGGIIGGVAGATAAMAGMKLLTDKAAETRKELETKLALPAAEAAPDKKKDPVSGRPVDTSEREKALDNIKQITAEFEKQSRLNIARIAHQTEFLGKTEQEKEIAMASRDLFLEYQNAFEQLQKRRLSLGKDEQFQVAEIVKQQDELYKLYLQQDGALVQGLTALQTAKKLEEDRLYFIDLQTKSLNTIFDIQANIANFSMSEDDRKIAALQRQIKLEEDAAVKREQSRLGATPITAEAEAAIREKVRKSTEGQLDAQLKLNAATKAESARLFVQDLQNTAIANTISLQAELAKLTMTSDQQRILDLQTQNKLLVQQEVAKRNALLKPGESIAASEIADITAQVTAANQGFITSTQALIDKSREFSTGYEQAFIKYKDDANNAATQSKTYFETFSKGFEDAIVSFVRTGKLSFKDLANSIIADIVRIQAKQLVLSLFGGGGGGGFLGAIGSLFGFANGGIPPVGVPSIVGERGPELFVPQSAGKIIPNHALGGGQSVVNNTTEVSYNISAVDAQSFKSMLARDPEFIHNVAEQGRRQLPIRSRR